MLSMLLLLNLLILGTCAIFIQPQQGLTVLYRHDRPMRTSPVDTSRSIKYHGGKLLTSPKVYFLFLGNTWKIDTPQVITLETLIKELQGSEYFGLLQFYQNAQGTAITGVSFGGSAFIDAPDPTVDETMLDSLVVEEITKKFGGFDDNGVYFLMVTPGIQLTNGKICSTTCGGHSALSTGTGKTVLYATVMYPTPDCIMDCYSQFISPNNDPGLDAMAGALMYNLAGMMTNPVNDGYYDEHTGEEGQDACVYQYGTVLEDLNGAMYNLQTATKKFLLQAMWVPMPEGNGACATRFIKDNNTVRL